MRQHLFVHHADQFEELLVLEGKGPTLSSGEGMKGHFLPKPPNRGAPIQDERDTLDSLLMLVTDEMDRCQRVESHAVHKTMCAVHPLDPLCALCATVCSFSEGGVQGGGRHMTGGGKSSGVF